MLLAVSTTLVQLGFGRDSTGHVRDQCQAGCAGVGAVEVYENPAQAAYYLDGGSGRNGGRCGWYEGTETAMSLYLYWFRVDE